MTPLPGTVVEYKVVCTACGFSHQGESKFGAQMAFADHKCSEPAEGESV